jgi:hypothetical protein
MISKNPSDGGPKGFLIDLDLAQIVDSDAPSGAPHRTGTIEFMAIEVLDRSAVHSWRHDLESFLYLLIWICIMYDGTRALPERPEMLKDWSGNKAVHAKWGHMTKDYWFQKLLNHFSDPFITIQEMVREMKDVLFPPGIGVFTGIYPDHKPVYERIIGILEREIAKFN